MPIVSMNIVLLGENFPISSLRVEDFEFRHRALRETMRLPVALRAETPDGAVVLQALPDRFEVAVLQVDQPEVQAAGLIELVQVFQDYVGRRTIRAVGHNAMTVLNGTTNTRGQLLAGLLQIERVSDYIGSTEPISGDISLRFKKGRESAARLQIRMAEVGDAVLDANFHFELSELGLTPLEAANLFPESLQHASALFDGFLEAMSPNGVQA